MNCINVLLRDFVADVAPTSDQELSQGHAPTLGVDEYAIVVPEVVVSGRPRSRTDSYRNTGTPCERRSYRMRRGQLYEHAGR